MSLIHSKQYGFSNLSDRHVPRVDRPTKCLIGVDIGHANVHYGRAFHYSAIGTLASSGDKILWSFTTPATSGGYIHAGPWKFYSSASATFKIMEDATIKGASAGTAKTPKNRHRGSANTANSILKEGAIASTVGDQLEIHRSGTSGGFFTAANPAAGEGRIEWQLDDNSIYTLEIQANADNLLYSVSINWYEESVRGDNI